MIRFTEEQKAAYEVWAHVESGHSHIELCRTRDLWWCPCWCHRHGHPPHPDVRRST